MAKQQHIWWHVDSQGRKIGWMWPEDFVAILSALYGAKTWRVAFCNYAGLSYNTVCYYAHGKQPIPRHIAMLVSLMSYHHDKTKLLERPVAEWLPKNTLSPNGTTPITYNEFNFDNVRKIDREGDALLRKKPPKKMPTNQNRTYKASIINKMDVHERLDELGFGIKL